jgi:hypothetical protein
MTHCSPNTKIIWFLKKSGPQAYEAGNRLCVICMWKRYGSERLKIKQLGKGSSGKCTLGKIHTSWNLGPIVLTGYNSQGRSKNCKYLCAILFHKANSPSKPKEKETRNKMQIKILRTILKSKKISKWNWYDIYNIKVKLEKKEEVYIFKVILRKLSIVVHICEPSSWEAEAGWS